MAAKTHNGGRAVVEALLTHGATHAFCVPGESYLPILDALHDARGKIRLVTCRHEAGAANMAEAYAKLTGKPGICLVTRGPGATQASVGVHTARQDSTPMILLVGQVTTADLGREAFQEVDLATFFKPLAKDAFQVMKADEIAPGLARAFHIAQSGRPGPVVVSLPEDVLFGEAPRTRLTPLPPERAKPSTHGMESLKTLLERAEKPLAILGGFGWSQKAVRDFRAFAEREGLPVTCAFRFQDLFDPRSENYAGDAGIGINPKLAETIKTADVILAIGPRLGEMTTSGYTLITPPVPEQTLVHVHAGKEELGRVYQADLAIHSHPAEFVTALKGMRLGRKAHWRAWREAVRENFLAWAKPVKNPGRVQIGKIYAFLNKVLPENTILTNGAGNYTAWLHRHYQYRAFKTQLAPTSGAMGYGVPAAIAAKIAEPQRTVVSVSGDGCFMMSACELATAVQEKAAVIFLVFNNGMYGTIRMHQERHFPGRVSGTNLLNPDFPALARAFGLKAWRAATNAAFEKAFRAALARKRPALIEVVMDKEAISPAATLSGLRKQKGNLT
ncbi:MAG TPA: thiamine pyrophosphate-binding protein [Sphingomonadales bacterium]|nr:thiamine pyrophosphate-binding protein [Sphingomonadales bacterium]